MWVWNSEETWPRHNNILHFGEQKRKIFSRTHVYIRYRSFLQRDFFHLKLANHQVIIENNLFQCLLPRFDRVARRMWSKICLNFKFSYAYTNVFRIEAFVLLCTRLFCVPPSQSWIDLVNMIIFYFDPFPRRYRLRKNSWIGWDSVCPPYPSRYLVVGWSYMIALASIPLKCWNTKWIMFYKIFD